MTGFNLPPGVSVSMIPGNRPEDIAIERAQDALLDRLIDEGLQPDEYQIVAEVGIVAVRQARELSRKDCEELRQENKELNEDIERLNTEIEDYH